MDDWTQIMDQAKAFAEENCIEWYELRCAVIDARVAEAPEMWEGHGIGSSDGNHMIYSATKLGELEYICRDLIARGELIRKCARGRDWRQVRQELAELFAPVPS